MSDVNTIFILKLLCTGGLDVGVINDNLSMLISRVKKHRPLHERKLNLTHQIPRTTKSSRSTDRNRLFQRKLLQKKPSLLVKIFNMWRYSSICGLWSYSQYVELLFKMWRYSQYVELLFKMWSYSFFTFTDDYELRDWKILCVYIFLNKPW
jgi:hypothetical protein